MDGEGQRCQFCVWLANLTYIWAALAIRILLVCLVIRAKEIKARNKVGVFLNLVPGDEVCLNGTFLQSSVVTEQEEDRHTRVGW